MLVTHARNCSRKRVQLGKEEEEEVSRRQTNEQCNWHTQVGPLDGSSDFGRCCSATETWLKSEHPDAALQIDR
jgi:hypothetical protein